MTRSVFTLILLLCSLTFSLTTQASVSRASDFTSCLRPKLTLTIPLNKAIADPSTFSLKTDPNSILPHLSPRMSYLWLQLRSADKLNLLTMSTRLFKKALWVQISVKTPKDLTKFRHKISGKVIEIPFHKLNWQHSDLNWRLAILTLRSMHDIYLDSKKHGGKFVYVCTRKGRAAVTGINKSLVEPVK